MSSNDSSIPKNLYYTKKHEWASVQMDGIVRIGITDYAQESLHEIVFVELPKTGAKAKRMEFLGTVESVKAVSEVYSPISGEVVKVNTALEKSPELVNKEPYGKGWIADIRPSDLKAELKSLLSPKEYARALQMT
ncbi:glycine cleavage system protein GcvH [Candidatus Bathyarchaeota archaeon]|nr:glycine cleavage system protein GcvH [Candidatus Bathyarchaeota archaeon]